PDDMVHRQPFPGPGLAVRIIGEVTRDRLETLRAADWIVGDEITAAGRYGALWHAFGILTPLQSVAVMGDHRTYGRVVAVRAVQPPPPLRSTLACARPMSTALPASSRSATLGSPSSAPRPPWPPGSPTGCWRRDGWYSGRPGPPAGSRAAKPSRNP